MHLSNLLDDIGGQQTNGISTIAFYTSTWLVKIDE